MANSFPSFYGQLKLAIMVAARFQRDKNIKLNKVIVTQNDSSTMIIIW